MAQKLKNGLTNLRGTKIGYLLVIRKLPNRKGKNKRPQWECECTAEGCGSIIKVMHNRLIDKVNPKSHCGCQTKGGLPSQFKKEYHAYWDAKSRCHNPDHPSYVRYGAKGIRMCDRWRDSFESFIEDMGAVPAGHSLDRIDAHGNYEPTNCRWACNVTQARNKKGTIYVLHPKTGEKVTIGDLADEEGLSYQQMRNKLIKEGKL